MAEGVPTNPGETKRPVTNWAGNYTYSVAPLQSPGSVEEIQALVKRHDHLKVLGTRHCFNHIADSKDHLISLDRLNKIAGLHPPMQLPANSTIRGHVPTVTIEAGVRYGELAVWLDQQGYALHNLASLPHISVVGGCATATHGSGVQNGNLSTAVRAMELITAAGELVTLSGEKDGEAFPGAMVHLGGLGVVTKITLAVEPAYQVRQVVYENLPLHQLEHHFEEIMSAGYSVSLFTEWRDRNFTEVWIKSKVPAGNASDGKSSADSAPARSVSTPPQVFFGATIATRDLHPIRDLSAEHATEQMGVPGPWHERLPHFRMGFTPSSGAELQTEYFIPRDRSFEAIMAVGRLHEKIASHILVSEIRCIAADDCWMSPCYHQACTAIHFTWKPDWPAVRQILPLIEAQLAPFEARPHWGKLFTISPERIRSLYRKLPDFRQLLQQYDPKGKFRNEFLDTLIFGK